MERAQGRDDNNWRGSARTGASSTAGEEHNRASPTVLLPASLNQSVGAHAHYLYKAAPEHAEGGSMPIMDMFLYQDLAEDVRRVAVNDSISKCKEILKMFHNLHNYQSWYATKDNYHSDALPITNMVISKIQQVVTSLEEVSRIISPGGVILDAQRNKLYLLDNC